MAMDGEWGDRIALWGLIDMLQVAVAILSNLGEMGLKVIYPVDCQNCQNKAQATGDMALLSHEAEVHYYSLESVASWNHQLATAKELKQKYGQEKIAEEICSKCG